MRYLYRQTGVVVESGTALDSAIFSLLNEKTEEKKPQESRQTKGGKSRGKQ